MATTPHVKLVEDEHLKAEAKQLYENLKKSTGSVPKWVKVMANDEDILVGFFGMFKATMDDTPLDATLKWKVANVVSEMNKCAFCVDVAHSSLKSLGVTDEELLGIDTPKGEREELAFEYAKRVTERAYEVDSALMEKMKNEFSDEELVELTAVIGLFNYINRFNDALGILPD